jgi:hypothetical protein
MIGGECLDTTLILKFKIFYMQILPWWEKKDR